LLRGRRRIGRGGLVLRVRERRGEEKEHQKRVPEREH
jgi:hypothetical protein